METPVRKKRAFGNILNRNDITPMKIPPSPFLEKLGYGTGVNVFRLKPNKLNEINASPWAIKCVSRAKSKEEAEYKKLYSERIIEEADCLRKLNHPNIVGFRAFEKAKDGRKYLAMEACTGSLGDLLESKYESNEGPLSVDKINKVCFDISKALDYLHMDALILHGDLKSFNILVKGDFEICKLCDFGVSQPIDQNGCLDFKLKPNAAYVGTIIWSAPEVIIDEKSATTKSEMFSFGLVVYEMITLHPPHTFNQDASKSIISISSTSSGDFNMDDEDFDGISKENILYGTRPFIPDVHEFPNEYNHILEIFYVCTNEDPDTRPTPKMITDLIKTKME